MKLITTEELGPRESILTADPLVPNSLRVKDPERFPFIHELVQTLMEKELRNGYLYAYLAHRFVGHFNCAGWRAYSQGPAGDEADLLLEKTTVCAESAEWSFRVLQELPEPWPAHERVFLAWLRGELPKHLFDHPPPSAKRIFTGTYDSRFRAMFRGGKKKKKKD